jgi:hypothetical protein
MWPTEDARRKIVTLVRALASKVGGPVCAADRHGRGRLSLGLLLFFFVLSGCLIRVGYWTGQSTSGPGTCVPFEFDLTLDGNRIGGSATTEFEWGTVLWNVAGTLNEGKFAVETITPDPRVTRPRIRWSGDGNILTGSLTEDVKDEACPAPRTVTLQRR